MSVSLYRKYRPQNLEEVVGQDAINKTLSELIAKKAYSHAYIFAGPRGTGKTSTARIFAKELGVSHEDLYEVDAASYTKKEDVEQLKSGISSLPFNSPYKLYLLDEAHMLSNHSWNSLLKTIEEPPAHVLFVFATTELHKVPDTIKSRCDIFTFVPPSPEYVKELLERVVKAEKAKVPENDIERIGKTAASYRDALGQLQMAIAGGADTAVVDNIDAVIEMITSASASELLQAVAANETTAAAYLESVTDAVREKLYQKVTTGAKTEVTSHTLRRLLELQLEAARYGSAVVAWQLYAAELVEESK